MFSLVYLNELFRIERQLGGALGALGILVDPPGRGILGFYCVN